jgi:Fe-S-cluster-containing hydrogenase component 2
MINRGINRKVSTPFELTSAECIACGTCITICPTGRLALSDVGAVHQPQHRVIAQQPFYCRLCDDAARIPSNGNRIAG